ncbi:hypothetical protein RP20_CCG017762 [Aedes albopictus]|nr:hypothetical protein RP20_CCG017762 [Aedes albopictus]
MPVNGNLIWAPGQRSWIAFPPSDGTLNSIVGKNLVSALIECVQGQTFRYVHDRTPLSITQVLCVRKVTGNVRTSPIPMNQCPGTFKAVGFDVPFPNSQNRFFDLFHVCFDERAAIPIFTRHTVYGNEIQHRSTSAAQTSFRVAGFPRQLDVSSAYTKRYQVQRLADLFASDPNPRGSVDMYYAVNSLHRGHLTPRADELLTTWQLSTFFYVNVVGMWETINNGNWKYLEESVRTLVDNSKKNLIIYTGIYGTLSLCSDKNHCRDFTLSNGRIPVPKWLWKVVKSPDSNAAIALVVSNNPFDRESPICGLGGESFGWSRKISLNGALGAVSYCSVQDLQRVVRYIPQEALAGNILRL